MIFINISADGGFDFVEMLKNCAWTVQTGEFRHIINCKPVMPFNL